MWQYISETLNIGHFLTCLLLLIVLLSRYVRIKDSLPPGPMFRLPVLGNILELKDPDFRKPLRRLHRKYGDVCSLYLGNKLTVIIAGFDAIKEAFQKNGNLLSHRPIMVLNDMMSNGHGIGSSSGQTWKGLRSFILSTFRNFGLGRAVLEERIHDEVKHFLDDVTKTNGKPFDMAPLIQASSCNIISAITFGGHFDSKDKTFSQIREHLDGLFHNIRVAGVVNFAPLLAKLPGDALKIKATMKHVDFLRGFFSELTHKIIDDFDETRVEDFACAFVKEMKKTRESTDSIFKVDHLVMTIMDLFIGGTETTSSTIMWSVLYLVNNPDVQRTLQTVVDKAVSPDEIPSVTDRGNMVYLEAFIMEVQRHANLLILSMPRTSPCDFSFRGYHIPKDTLIIPNLDSVLSDKAVWGDPETFRPERFVDEKGRIQKPPEFIPFFIGRRSCPGESLAKMELFIFLSGLVQRFHFSAPEGADLSLNNLDGIFGVTHTPKPFQIVATPRHPLPYELNNDKDENINNI